ncbi:hypothetical protein [Sphingobacterium anhuiense]|uniref:Uncharacterized protein n=1 Tax=Sphingobacterium anhuiense TaxID=493780 RepID=A0ABW5YX53_9SPHI
MDIEDITRLRAISDAIEVDYLHNFDNTKAHFVAIVDENKYSEITFGQTVIATRDICRGYVEDPSCQILLEIADEKTFELDFWSLVL